MKFTKYFKYRMKSPDRSFIQNKWIRWVIENPLKTERQHDGRIRKWGRIPEIGGKVLRVILLEDGATVHNAFFDRDFIE